MSDIDNPALQADEPVATDNSPQVDTSEASTQIVEAPEATQGTVEAEETPTTEIEAKDKAKKLLAGTFKDVSELEKGYQELRNKFTQTTSEKAELSRILNEAFVDPTPQAPVQDDTYEEPDPINQEIDNLKRVTAVQSFVMNHQDADPANMQKILSEDPLVRQISGHEAKLEYAYLRSQNMAQQKAIVEAQKSGAQAATAKIAEKQVAQVEAASKTSEQDDGSDLLDRATGNHPREVRDKARLEIIRKNLVNL